MRLKNFNLFEAQTPVEASGKTIDALEFSRSKRDEILDYFGGDLPLSIMQAQKGRAIGEDDCAFQSYDDSGQVKDKKSPLYKAFGVSGRGAANGALSVFPQNICKACVLLYTQKGDTILDPFAGHNSRMECCIRLARNYIGFDISHRFMEFNRKRYAELTGPLYGLATLYEQDSRYIPLLSDVAIGQELGENLCDFTISSPPYWDIEDYGDEQQQLGKCSRTYDEFMDNMRLVMANVYANLKPGAFCAWFINDFRRKKVFYPYHTDSLYALKHCGFEPWDIIITNFGWTMRAAFATQILGSRILPKIHEYGLIMRKPMHTP